MRKFKKDRDLQCPKCGHNNGVESDRKVQFAPSVTFPATQTSQEVTVPESITVYCWKCSYRLEQFNPNDTVLPDTP